jgi:hypothetical protein
MLRVLDETPKYMRLGALLLIEIVTFISVCAVYDAPNAIFYIVCAAFATVQCRENGRRHEIFTLIWVGISLCALWKTLWLFGLALLVVDVLLVWNMAYSTPVIAAAPAPTPTATTPSLKDMATRMATAATSAAERVASATTAEEAATAASAATAAASAAGAASAASTIKADEKSVSMQMHARIPVLRLPIPWITYSIGDKAVTRSTWFGKYDPEPFSRIENWYISGSFTRALTGCSCFGFRSKKPHDDDYVVWRFIPVQLAVEIDQACKKAAGK